MTARLMATAGRRFSPLDVPDLALWVDASAITGKVDGNTIGQWDDRSGNGRHLLQPTGGSQPTYRTGVNGIGGRPAVRFDGTDDYLYVDGSLNVKDGVTSVAAVKSPVANRDGALWGKGAGDLAAMHTWNDRAYAMSEAEVAWIVFASGGVSLNAEVITHRYDAATGDAAVLMNGTTKATGNYAASNLANTLRLLVGATGTDAGGTSVANFTNETLAELLIYTRPLTATERQQVERYMGDKYAIAVS